MNAERLLAHYERIADAPDAIARLRRFILALAVRGKLVPQDRKDEPAAELLKRIAREKARLVKAGEIRDKVSLSVVAEEEMPFQLPAAWRWVRFANIVEFSAGRTPSRNDTSFWNNGDYAWVSIADMQDGQILTATRETVSGKARDKVFGSDPEAPGTIIMSFKLTIGKIARLGIPAFHNEAIISIRPHIADLDGFLFRVFPQFAKQGDIKGAIKGATLNRDSISKILLPLPPLAEQHRIVAKVDELMALCDRLEAARSEREATRDRLAASTLARLNTPDPATFQADARFALNTIPALTTRPDQIKQLRQTILNHAVRGKLVPQDPKDEPAGVLLERIHKWSSEAIQKKQIRAPRKPLQPIVGAEVPYMQPTGWVWARLGEIIYIQSGDGLTAANMEHGDVPVFGGNGVNGYHNRGNVNERTIVIGRVGYYCGSIHVTPPQAWVTDNAFITHFSSNSIFLEFLVLLLNATNLKEDENATAQPVISGSKIYPIVVGLPPLAEQHRIVARVDALMKICNQLEASLGHTATTRRNLLDAVLAEALSPAEIREREAAE